MKAHEMFVQMSAENPDTMRDQQERDREAEQLLQMGWYQHICTGLTDREHLAATLQEIIHNSPEQKERIEKADLDMQRDIILETMILSPELLPEARWFRTLFPRDDKGESLPLKMETRNLLDAFSTQPEQAYTNLDRMYLESLTKH